MKSEYKIKIHNLEKLFVDGCYFEIICASVQFLDFFASKLNEKIPLSLVSLSEQSEIESQTNLSFQEWVKLKTKISESMQSERSSKYKLLSVLDNVLSNELPNIEVSADLITRINKIFKIRNILQHEYYKTKITNTILKNTANDCLMVCKLFEKFDREGYFDH